MRTGPTCRSHRGVFAVLMAEVHDWRASLDPATLYLAVDRTLVCVIKAATAF